MKVRRKPGSRPLAPSRNSSASPVVLLDGPWRFASGPGGDVWRPFRWIASGIGVIAVWIGLAVVANAYYEAIMFVLIGLTLVGVGSAILIFRLARPRLPRWVVWTAAVVSAAGLVASVGTSAGLLGPALGLLALSTLHWWLARSSPMGRALVALAAVTTLVLVVLTLVA